MAIKYKDKARAAKGEFIRIKQNFFDRNVQNVYKLTATDKYEVLQSFANEIRIDNPSEPGNWLYIGKAYYTVCREKKTVLIFC